VLIRAPGTPNECLDTLPRTRASQNRWAPTIYLRAKPTNLGPTYAAASAVKSVGPIDCLGLHAIKMELIGQSHDQVSCDGIGQSTTGGTGCMAAIEIEKFLEEHGKLNQQQACAQTDASPPRIAPSHYRGNLPSVITFPLF
jgi:hypothetical protein